MSFNWWTAIITASSSVLSYGFINRFGSLPKLAKNGDVLVDSVYALFNAT
jgi:hypothetical protein